MSQQESYSGCSFDTLHRELRGFRRRSVSYRELVSKDPHCLATATWYPQTWNNEDGKEVLCYIPLEKLKERLRKENFSDILNCACNKCSVRIEEAKDFGYSVDYFLTGAIEYIEDSVLNRGLCRLFALLIECQIPTFIKFFIDTDRKYFADTSGKYERIKLEKIKFKKDIPNSTVFKTEEISYILERQDVYFEETIPWDSAAPDIKVIQHGSRLPILFDVTTLDSDPSRDGGSESQVLAINILRDSKSAQDFQSRETALLGSDIMFDLNKKHPFVIKIFKTNTTFPREMSRLKNLRTFYRRYRNYICPDLASFIYANKYCIIFPRAIGSLEQLYRETMGTQGSAYSGLKISSITMWEQLGKVGEGIRFIHEKLNMHHTDIKPGNILIFEASNFHGGQRESDMDADGESAYAQTNFSLTASHPLRPKIEDTFVLPVVFRICDLGHSNLGADSGEGPIVDMGAESPVILGDPDWRPPFWSDWLKVPKKKVDTQALKAYDYWTYGAVLLEGGVFDMWRKLKLGGSVADSRATRTEQGPGRPKFYVNDREKNILKPIVIQHLEALKNFSYGPAYEQQNPEDLPESFYHEISGHIEQLLRIGPVPNPHEADLTIDMSERKFGSTVCLKNIIEFILEKARQSNEASINALQSGGELATESEIEGLITPQRSNTQLNRNSENKYLSGKWGTSSEDMHCGVSIHIPKNQTFERKMAWRRTQGPIATEGWVDSHVITLSVPTQDFTGPFEVESNPDTPEQESHDVTYWKFSNIEDSSLFFTALTGVYPYAKTEPLTGVLVQFAVSIPKTPVLNGEATLYFWTSSPICDGQMDGKSWLVILPEKNNLGTGFILKITRSIELYTKKTTEILINGKRQPGRRAGAFPLPLKIDAPFQPEKFEPMGECIGNVIFKFANKMDAVSFRRSFNKLQSLQPKTLSAYHL